MTPVNLCFVIDLIHKNKKKEDLIHYFLFFPICLKKMCPLFFKGELDQLLVCSHRCKFVTYVIWMLKKYNNKLCYFELGIYEDYIYRYIR